MSTKLVIGNALDRVHPLRGVMKEIRFGRGDLATTGANEPHANLTPFFANSLTDTSYWYSTDTKHITQLTDGWAHIACDNSSGTAQLYIGFEPKPIAGIKADVGYSLLVEFRNIDVAAGNPFVALSQDTTNWQMAPASSKYFYLSSIADGATFVPETSAAAPYDTSVIQLLSLYSFIPAGASCSFDLRLSLYEGTYTGEYVPYATQYDYSFHTLDLDTFESTFPAGQDVSVNRISEFFINTNDRRMTSNANLFVPLTSTTGDKYYRRQDIDKMVSKATDYRNYGQGTDSNDDIGVSFNLTKVTGAQDDAVWFDNSLFNVSDLLWEFNPTGGEGRWYQLYMLPGRETCRVTLPESTNTLRARVLSNDMQTWVQKMGIWPVADLQRRDASVLAWATPGVATDSYNYVTWNAPTGGIGAILYTVYDSSGNKLGTTRFRHWQLASGVTVGHVVAADSMTSISSAT